VCICWCINSVKLTGTEFCPVKIWKKDSEFFSQNAVEFVSRCFAWCPLSHNGYTPPKVQVLWVLRSVLSGVSRVEQHVVYWHHRMSQAAALWPCRKVQCTIVCTVHCTDNQSSVTEVTEIIRMCNVLCDSLLSNTIIFCSSSLWSYMFLEWKFAPSYTEECILLMQGTWLLRILKYSKFSFVKTKSTNWQMWTFLCTSYSS